MVVNENWREWESWWDRAARGVVVNFATTIAVLYAVGLLIVNLDLARYDVVAIDLGRPEYVMVGLLWATLVTITSVVIWSVFWLVHDVMQPSALFEPMGRTARFGVVVGVVPLLLILYILILKVVCGGGPDLAIQRWFLNLVLGLVVQAFLILGIVSVLIFFKRKLILTPGSPQSEEFGSRHILALFAATGTSVAFGLLGLLSYASFVFPELPREWGGGVKPVVELFLTEKLPVFADGKDIPSTGDGKRIGPVICILETDRTLIISPLNFHHLANKGYETIAIDRKGVAAVVYEGHYGPSYGGLSPITASPNPTTSRPIAP